MARPTISTRPVISTKKLKLCTEWCKGCGICVAFCPKSVLKLDRGKVAISDKASCIACGMCEMLCPDYAIYLKEDNTSNEQ